MSNYKKLKSVWHSALSLGFADSSVPLEPFCIFELFLENNTDVNHWVWFNIVALDEMAHQVPLVLVGNITYTLQKAIIDKKWETFDGLKLFKYSIKKWMKSFSRAIVFESFTCITHKKLKVNFKIRFFSSRFTD